MLLLKAGDDVDVGVTITTLVTLLPELPEDPAEVLGAAEVLGVALIDRIVVSLIISVGTYDPFVAFVGAATGPDANAMSK